MKKIVYISLLCLFLSVNSLSAGQETGIKLWGSNYVDINGYHYLNNTESDSLKFGGMNTLNLNFHNRNKRYGKIEGNFDLIIPFGLTADQFQNLIEQSEQSDTLSLPYYPIFVQGNAPILLDIRKLYASVYLSFADITLGRQIVNFGKGCIFSPIDVFSTVDVSDINFQRHGSDIAAVKIPFSYLSGCDLITEFPRKHREYSSALRLYHHMWGFDFAANAIYKHRSDDFIGGISFKGDAFVGIYGEFVEHCKDDFKTKYFEGMLGADYSIKNTFFFRIEYLYKNPNISSQWGKHNIFASAEYMINDLMRVSMNVLGSDVSGNAQTIMYMGQFYYNILQNVNVVLYTRYFSYKQENPLLPDLEYAVRVEVKF